MKPKVLKPEHKQHVPSARRMVRVFSLLRELAVLQRARYPVYIPEAHYRKLLKGP